MKKKKKKNRIPTRTELSDLLWQTNERIKELAEIVEVLIARRKKKWWTEFNDTMGVIGIIGGIAFFIVAILRILGKQ